MEYCNIEPKYYFKGDKAKFTFGCSEKGEIRNVTVKYETEEELIDSSFDAKNLTLTINSPIEDRLKFTAEIVGGEPNYVYVLRLLDGLYKDENVSVFSKITSLYYVDNNDTGKSYQFQKDEDLQLFYYQNKNITELPGGGIFEFTTENGETCSMYRENPLVGNTIIGSFNKLSEIIHSQDDDRIENIHLIAAEGSQYYYYLYQIDSTSYIPQETIVSMEFYTGLTDTKYKTVFQVCQEKIDEYGGTEKIYGYYFTEIYPSPSYAPKYVKINGTMYEVVNESTSSAQGIPVQQAFFDGEDAYKMLVNDAKKTPTILQLKLYESPNVALYFEWNTLQDKLYLKLSKALPDELRVLINIYENPNTYKEVTFKSGDTSHSIDDNITEFNVYRVELSYGPKRVEVRGLGYITYNTAGNIVYLSKEKSASALEKLSLYGNPIEQNTIWYEDVSGNNVLAYFKKEDDFLYIEISEKLSDSIEFNVGEIGRYILLPGTQKVSLGKIVNLPILTQCMLNGNEKMCNIGDKTVKLNFKASYESLRDIEPYIYSSIKWADIANNVGVYFSAYTSQRYFQVLLDETLSRPVLITLYCVGVTDTCKINSRSLSGTTARNYDIYTSGLLNAKIFSADSMYLGDKLLLFDANKSRKFMSDMTTKGNDPANVPWGILSKPRYFITDYCTSCGTCLDICPTDAIEVASPYIIQPNKCISCGVCAKVCPSRAIDLIS